MPLFLLLAQQGAVTHELSHEVSHARSPAGSSLRNVQTDKQVAADALCLTCLSHADLPGLIKADDFRPGLAGVVHAQPQAPARAVRAALSLAPRSRGPPSFL